MLLINHTFFLVNSHFGWTIVMDENAFYVGGICMVKNILYSELNFKIMFFRNAISCGLLHSCQQVQGICYILLQNTEFRCISQYAKIKACFEWIS